MESTWVLICLLGFVVFFTSLNYLHVGMDKAISFSNIGYSISAISDSPERQLITLFLVTVFSYVISSLSYGTAKTETDSLISLFGLLLCMCLFGTILTRASTNPKMHYALAALTMFLLLVVMISMAIRIKSSAISSLWYSRTAVVLTVVVTLCYIAAATMRVTLDLNPLLSSTMIGVLEVFSCLMFVLLLIIYYQT